LFLGADIDGVFACDREDFVGDERPGRDMQPRIGGAVVFAEQQLDRFFLGLDRIE
jgi:hypothetical protein